MSFLKVLLISILSSAAYAAKPAVPRPEVRWSPLKDDALQLKAGWVTPGLDFTLLTPGTDFVFVPNSPGAVFVEGSYGNFGLGFQIPVSADEESVRKKGRSELSDYQFRFFGHRWTFEAIYQRFKGYSLQDWSMGGAPIYRSDIGIEYSGITVIESLSPAYYSPAVAYDQKGYQTSGGGGLLLWASVGRTKIFADQALIPSFVDQNAGQMQSFRGLDMYAILAGIGYGYTQPIKSRFYISGAVISGYGVQRQAIDLADGVVWKTDPIFRIGIRPALGYNHERHFGGIQMIVDSNVARTLDSQIQQATFALSVFYGYRLTVPKPKSER